MARQFTKSGTTRGNGQDAVRNAWVKRLKNALDSKEIRSLPEDSDTRKCAVAIFKAAVAELDRRGRFDKDTLRDDVRKTVSDVSDGDWEAGVQLASALTDELV